MNFYDVMHYLKQENWIIQVFLVVLLVVLVNWAQKRVIGNLIEKFQRMRMIWNCAIMRAAYKPITLLIWILGLTFIADIIKIKTDIIIFDISDPVRKVGIIIIIFWFLGRFVLEAKNAIFQKKQADNESFDQTTYDAVTKLLRISIIIVGSLVVLQTLGYSISGVLAFGGIGGIAVGFAARDLLANFFGGLIIYMDRPFDVGDWIRSPDREIEGTVEKIGWRLTTIRTFDKRPLYVPNSIFTTIAVENPSRMRNRRIKETIGIRYDDVHQIREILTDVKVMLQQHRDIDNNQTLIVNFNEFADSSLNFFIYTFTKTIDWIEFHKVKEDVLLKIIDIIEAHGAECAFPTSTIHVPETVKVLGEKIQAN